VQVQRAPQGSQQQLLALELAPVPVRARHLESAQVQERDPAAALESM
jgi:hypothetical protein